MLQFQVGEYCICIWDGEQTRLSRALESLNRYTEDEKATQDELDMVNPRDLAKRIHKLAEKEH